MAHLSNAQRLQRSMSGGDGLADDEAGRSGGQRTSPLDASPNSSDGLRTASSSSSMTSAITTGVRAEDINQNYMDKLKSFILPRDELERRGYRLQQYSQDELEGKKRCVRCEKYMKVSKNRSDHGFAAKNNSGSTMSKEGPDSTIVASRRANDTTFVLGTSIQQNAGQATVANVSKTPIMRCFFHPGACMNRKWSCCGQNGLQQGCKGSEHHTARIYPSGQLKGTWKFYATSTQPPLPSYRHAVAIDCEMGTSQTLESELIRVTMIDYFTSEILVDGLVWPDVPMQHYNTRYSGITAAQMYQAKRTGQCYLGRRQALKACWRFVGVNTIIVGHGCQNDLTALRWIHDQVVDTFLIEEGRRKAAVAREQESTMEKAEPGQDAQSGEAKPKRTKGTGPLTLKTLVSKRLGRDIQNKGRAGHDSLEDAVAARDLAHWNVMNKDTLSAQC